MTSRILNRFNIKTDRLLGSLATDTGTLSCDIHPRKMIKMVRLVSRDHIIIAHKGNNSTIQVYSVTVMTHIELEDGQSSQGIFEPIVPA